MVTSRDLYVCQPKKVDIGFVNHLRLTESMTTTKRSRSRVQAKRLVKTAKVKTVREPIYVAVIGDVVRSRVLTRGVRSSVQRSLERILEKINIRYRSSLAAKFLVTIGDEFQGLLLEPSVLPALIRDLESALPDVELRLGIGRGQLYTDLKEYAIGTDGPAWHAARTAIEDAKTNRRLGGVFIGFGSLADATLNGFARVLYHLRARLTVKQRALLEQLLDVGTQAEIAASKGVSRQAISKQVKASGGEAYREAENAWRMNLANTSRETVAHES
jgi:hypothetical protein